MAICGEGFLNLLGDCSQVRSRTEVAHYRVIRVGSIVKELGYCTAIQPLRELLELVLRLQVLDVLLQECIPLQVLGLRGVDAVLSVVHLDHASVAVPHG